jgi:hypothetical protein
MVQVKVLTKIKLDGADESFPVTQGLYSNTTPVANVGAGEDDLMSYEIPANTFENNGDSLTIDCQYLIGGTAQLSLYVGATQFAVISLVDDEAGTSVRWRITRTGASSLIVTAFGGVASQGYGSGAAQIGSVNFANALTIKSTAQGTNDGDLTQVLMRVQYEPAA